MGLITIACPSCKALTEWFTGNPDQRCHRCKYEAQQSPAPLSRYNGEPLPAGVWPRLPHCPVHAEPDQPERDPVDTLFEEANSGFGSGSDDANGKEHGT